MNEGSGTAVGNSIAGGVNGTALPAANPPTWVSGFDPPTPAAPIAVADSYSTTQDTALVQAAPGVLANDTDANSDPLTAVLNANVTHGSLTLNANGSFTYTPTTGYSGPDSFTYHANDGTADSNVVTVSLTVNARPARLVAIPEQRAGQLNIPQPWHGVRHADVRRWRGRSGDRVQRHQPIRDGARQQQPRPDHRDDAGSMDPAGRASTPGTQDLIKKASTTGTITNGYELALSTTGKVFVRLNNAAAARVNSTTNYPLSDSAWMHVAATFDSATIKLYINGNLEGSWRAPRP